MSPLTCSQLVLSLFFPSYLKIPISTVLLHYYVEKYIFNASSWKGLPPGLFLNYMVSGINSITSTTTFLSQSSVGRSVGVSSGNHTISATTAVSEKNTTHTCLCDLLSHATSCCVHATCCVEMKPDTRKTETTKIKPPKQNETLMYYVLRTMYSLLRPPVLCTPTLETWSSV